MNASLLVELFTEELPPKALQQLGEAFGLRLQDGLVRAQLKDKAAADTRIFATPRRLAVLIPDVRAKAEDRTESKKLMPAKVAFGADGKPSAALAKRLEKEGATRGSDSSAGQKAIPNTPSSRRRFPGSRSPPACSSRWRKRLPSCRFRK